MKKIVFIITDLTTGGAETMLHKLIQHLDRKEYSPHVISLKTAGEFGARFEAIGVPVDFLNISSATQALRALVKLVVHLRRMRPHIVQTWMYHADLLGGIAARIAGVPVLIWALRNTNLAPELNKRSTLTVVRLCAALSRWLPTVILSCSSRAVECHVEWGYRNSKLRVIPNGFDLSKFKPDHFARESVRKELGIPASAPLVGLMARFDLQKNHSGFLEAASMIRQELPDVQFVLAGSGIGPENTKLTEWISKRQLGSCTHLLGRRDDMPRLMASLDVLASSSLGEAFPNVLGEAMASGVPCVVTDVGDSAEIVGGTGRTVTSGDMRGLANQIVEILRLPVPERVNLAKAARERVATRYEISKIARRYEAFLKSVKSR